jgi:hypothetical protein
MRWSQLDSSQAPGRFGHTAVALEAGGGTVVVYGGVSARPDAGEHTALADVVVFDAESQRWSSPEVQGDGPGPRAFHTGCALGSCVYIFGGHVLSFDSEANKKKRNFYDDLWCLDTVRPGHLAAGRRPPPPLGARRAPLCCPGPGPGSRGWLAEQSDAVLLRNTPAGAAPPGRRPGRRPAGAGLGRVCAAPLGGPGTHHARRRCAPQPPPLLLPSPCCRSLGPGAGWRWRRR